MDEELIEVYPTVFVRWAGPGWYKLEAHNLYMEYTFLQPTAPLAKAYIDWLYKQNGKILTVHHYGQKPMSIEERRKA